MKKVIILNPVFNDWKSVNKLYAEISRQISALKQFEFSLILVNDASTETEYTLHKPHNIKSLTILNMRENRSHQRCIAAGLKYIMQNINFDYVVVMDADGEDRPEEVVMLLDKMGANSQSPVVAKRIKRSEGLMFRILYQIHKIITYIFTGKIMNFGNFVCLTKDNVSKIINERSLWNNFSGTIRNKFKKLESINCIRGNRYFGPSKMSFLKLFIHSMSIISVFNKVVYLRSILYLATAFLLEFIFSLNIFKSFLILLLFFNLIIFFSSQRSNAEGLNTALDNIRDAKSDIH